MINDVQRWHICIYAAVQLCTLKLKTWVYQSSIVQYALCLCKEFRASI